MPLCRIATAIAAVALACSASLASAQEDETKDALQVFDDYATYGADLALEAYVNAARTQYLARDNGYYPREAALATYWSYQSAYYGYYGSRYDYRDWVAFAGDAANASWNFNWGIFEVLYQDLYPVYEYDEIVAAYNWSYYAGAYAYYAEYYFDLAVDVVTPDEVQDGGDRQP